MGWTGLNIEIPPLKLFSKKCIVTNVVKELKKRQNRLCITRGTLDIPILIYLKHQLAWIKWRRKNGFIFVKDAEIHRVVNNR